MLRKKALLLGEGLFDGRQIGRIGGQKEQLTSSGLDGLAHWLPLCALKLSITTICPGVKLGASTCST
jgi:hypothetical protein